MVDRAGSGKRAGLVQLGQVREMRVLDGGGQALIELRRVRWPEHE